MKANWEFRQKQWLSLPFTQGGKEQGGKGKGGWGGRGEGWGGRGEGQVSLKI